MQIKQLNYFEQSSGVYISQQGVVKEIDEVALISIITIGHIQCLTSL